MKTSITVKVDRSNLSSKLKNMIKNSINETVLSEIGDTIVRMNRKNARTGKDGKGHPFPKPSEKWQKYREKLSQKNKPHMSYGKYRSNATFTGQLLDQMIYLIDEKYKTIKIDFSEGKRDQYVGLRVKLIGSDKTTSKDIAEGFSDRGSKIIGLNQEMKDRIKFILTLAIKKMIKF